MTYRFCSAVVTLLLTVCFEVSPSAAAPVVNTYQVVSRFTSGPITSVTQRFTLAFDPTIATSPMLVSNYISSVSDPSFNQSGVLFRSALPQNLLAGAGVFVGGALNGVAVPTAGTFDFENVFYVTPTGEVTNGGQLVTSNTVYSNATSSFTTADVTVTLLTGAAPEPDIWAMMILGFGIVGAGLRRRPKFPLHTTWPKHRPGTFRAALPRPRLRMIDRGRPAVWEADGRQVFSI